MTINKTLQKVKMIHAQNLRWCRTSKALYTQARMAFSNVNYDCVVIGGGPGGYVAAIKAGQRGLKTAVIEKRGALGGTCLNVGCIPSKALLNATHKLHEAQHTFKKMGINVGEISVDFPQMMKQKSDTITGLTGGIAGLMKKNKVDYFEGYGKFGSSSTVEVDLNKGGTETLNFKNAIIATGSEPNSLPATTGLSTDEEFVVSSTGALALKSIPKKMVVIGGGVIGLEMGSVYQRLGTEVTVIQHGDRICPFLDAEISKAFMNSLKKQGIKFKLNAAVTSGVNNREKGVVVNINDEKKNT
jgi:dihydrolipoamide dehydrogenase